MAETPGLRLSKCSLFVLKSQGGSTWNFPERSHFGGVDAALVQTSTTILGPGPLAQQSGAFCLDTYGPVENGDKPGPHDRRGIAAGRCRIPRAQAMMSGVIWSSMKAMRSR